MYFIFAIFKNFVFCKMKVSFSKGGINKKKKAKCFCNSFAYYTYVTSIAGVLPVRVHPKKKFNTRYFHQTEPWMGTKVVISKIWYCYSLLVILMYFPQILVAQYVRFKHVSKSIFNDIDW